MVDDRFEPESAPRLPAGHGLVESLGENASPATGLSAAKSANRDPQLNGTTVGRQVEEPPIVAAVHPLGLPSAIGALGSSGATSGGDDDAVWSDLDVIDQQAGGRQ
jgi:hypothetical protein